MTEQNTESPVRYKHFRTLRHDIREDGVALVYGNLGGVTLAYREVPASEGVLGHVVIGIAICSHKDNFHRAKGREIAEKRLNEKPAAIQAEVFEVIAKHARGPLALLQVAPLLEELARYHNASIIRLLD